VLFSIPVFRSLYMSEHNGVEHTEWELHHHYLRARQHEQKVAEREPSTDLRCEFERWHSIFDRDDKDFFGWSCVMLVHANRVLQKYTHEFRAQGSCHMRHSEAYHSSSPARTASKTVHLELLGHCFSQKLPVMPSASVQNGSTGIGGAWMKV
jgi:hypothetical protein